MCFRLGLSQYRSTSPKRKQVNFLAILEFTRLRFGLVIHGSGHVKGWSLRLSLPVLSFRHSARARWQIIRFVIVSRILTRRFDPTHRGPHFPPRV